VVLGGLPPIGAAARAATGADPKTGDGAGILLQIPDELLRSEVDFELPRMGAYAVGNAFLPTEPDLCAKAKASIEQITGLVLAAVAIRLSSFSLPVKKATKYSVCSNSADSSLRSAARRSVSKT
jgi:glutamate synthase domain-containing protein 1